MRRLFQLLPSRRLYLPIARRRPWALSRSRQLLLALLQLRPFPIGCGRARLLQLPQMGLEWTGLNPRSVVPGLFCGPYQPHRKAIGNRARFPGETPVAGTSAKRLPADQYRANRPDSSCGRLPTAAPQRSPISDAPCGDRLTRGALSVTDRGRAATTQSGPSEPERGVFEQELHVRHVVGAVAGESQADHAVE